MVYIMKDHFCGLVVRAPDCTPIGSGFDSRRYQTALVAVGLEQGPHSNVRINEELLERKSSSSGLQN
jgi:hypothetical protein